MPALLTDANAALPENFATLPPHFLLRCCR
jgi:hypothetical protein